MLTIASLSHGVVPADRQSQSKRSCQSTHSTIPSITHTPGPRWHVLRLSGAIALAPALQRLYPPLAKTNPRLESLPAVADEHRLSVHDAWLSYPAIVRILHDKAPLTLIYRVLGKLYITPPLARQLFVALALPANPSFITQSAHLLPVFPQYISSNE